MRWTAFILAIVVLALSCMPCEDAVYDMHAEKVKTSVSQSPEQQHNDADNCSPFCQCTCCASFAFSLEFYSLAPPVDFTASRYTDHHRSGIIEISLPIWQPPQLS